MEYNSDFERLGYHAIQDNPQAEAALENRQIDSSNSVILNVGEIITPRAIVYKDTDYTDKDNNPVYAIRLHCETSSENHDHRLLKLNHFNPYPANRAEWLSGSPFGESVLSYSGSAKAFMQSLIGRSFKVVKREKLKCKAYNRNNELVETEKYFHLFEEVKK